MDIIKNMNDEELPSMEQVEEKPPKEKVDDPYFPFTLLMIAGVLAILNGILLFAMNPDHVGMVQFEGGDVDLAVSLLFYAAIIEILVGIAVVALGGLARAKKPGLIKVGAVLSIISLGPLLLSSILAVISLVIYRKNQLPSEE